MQRHKILAILSLLAGRMPKGVLIGLVCRFSIMPLIGFGLATTSGLASGIAVEMGHVASMGLAPAVFGSLHWLLGEANNQSHLQKT